MVSAVSEEVAASVELVSSSVVWVVLALALVVHSVEVSEREVLDSVAVVLSAVCDSLVDVSEREVVDSKAVVVVVPVTYV